MAKGKGSLLTRWLPPALRGATTSPWKPWDDAWYQNVAEIGTATGIPVTPMVALQVAAVFACVKVISETVASLPCLIYRRRSDGGKERASGHPLYSLLHDSPNDWMTAFEFFEDMTGHIALHGKGFAEILPGPRGAVDRLIPLRPEWVQVDQLETRRLVYTVKEPKRLERILTQDQVLHVRGRALDFVNGMAVHAKARDAIALARAIDLYAAKFFANDATVGLLLEHPGRLSPQAQKRLQDELVTWMGLRGAHRPRVLEEGMKVNRLQGTPAKDAQLTEAQQEAVIPICQYFRMPPHKIQWLLRATFSNIEQQGIEFATDTILPWARRWEQRISASLISAPETYFAEFLLTGLLRGDSAARASFYSQLFNIGAITQNEIRGAENLNPVPEGDRLFVQGALVPTDRVDEVLDRRADAGRRATDQPPAAGAAGAAAPQQALAPVQAFRVLLADAAERIALREARDIAPRVAKAGEEPDGRLAGWLEWFYRGHMGYVVRALTPLATAWEEETGLRVPVASLAFAILEGGFRAADGFEPWRDARAAAILELLRASFAAAAPATGARALPSAPLVPALAAAPA